MSVWPYRFKGSVCVCVCVCVCACLSLATVEKGISGSGNRQV